MNFLLLPLLPIFARAAVYSYVEEVNNDDSSEDADDYGVSQLTEDIFVRPFLHQSSCTDSLRTYCLMNLKAVQVSRRASLFLRTFIITESFASSSIIPLANDNRGVEILQKMFEFAKNSMEQLSLDMAPCVMLPTLKYRTRNLAKQHPQAFRPIKHSTPLELIALSASSKSVHVKFAIAMWREFIQSLSYASSSIRKVFWLEVGPLDAVELRLKQLEDSILSIWTVDHLYLWGNVMSSFYYAEYLRHLLLAQGNVFGNFKMLQQWQRLKRIFPTLIDCIPVFDKNRVLLDMALEPPRYFMSNFINYLFVMQVPTTGSPLLQLEVISDTLYVYCSFLSLEWMLIRTELDKCQLDQDLYQRIFTVLTQI